MIVFFSPFYILPDTLLQKACFRVRIERILYLQRVSYCAHNESDATAGLYNV